MFYVIWRVVRSFLQDRDLRERRSLGLEPGSMEILAEVYMGQKKGPSKLMSQYFSD